MPDRKILLLASFIGSGHKKAAEAVESALKERSGGDEVRLINFFEYAHPGIAGAISSLYFKLLNSNPRTWGYLYDPREGKAKIAEISGLRSIFEGIRMKSSFERGFDSEVEERLNSILKNTTPDSMSMRELLQFLGAKPEVSGKIYIEEKDRITFPYSLIGRKLRLLRMLGSFLVSRMKDLIREYGPDVIVCTQVLPCMFVDRVKAREGIKTPLVAVLTDFGLHSYWLKPNVDAFVVPCSEVAGLFENKGVSKDKIHEFGIPVNGKFNVKKDKMEMRGKLGLDPRLFTVLVMGGGSGFLVDISVALRLWENTRLPFQVVIIAGENEELKKDLEGLRGRTRIPVFVHGFVGNIDEFMASSDVIITKPGGLSITEAMISCVPMVLVKVIQGQEDNNMRYLLRKKAAIDAGKGRNTGLILKDLYENPEKLNELWRRARGLAYTDSASNIANLILSFAGRESNVQ